MFAPEALKRQATQADRFLSPQPTPDKKWPYILETPPFSPPPPKFCFSEIEALQHTYTHTHTHTHPHTHMDNQTHLYSKRMQWSPDCLSPRDLLQFHIWFSECITDPFFSIHSRAALKRKWGRRWGHPGTFSLSRRTGYCEKGWATVSNSYYFRFPGRKSV